MKDLDLSNAEGLDESITESYSGFLVQPNKYLLYILKYKSGTAFTDAEKADIFRIENSPSIVEKTKASSLRSQNGLSVPSLITPEPAPASASAPAPASAPASSAPASAPAEFKPTLPSTIGENIKSVVKDVKSKALEKAETKEETKEEPAKVEETKKDVSKSGEDKTETDKILGMPKMVAYGLGAVIVLVGGFVAYKKFKK